MNINLDGTEYELGEQAQTKLFNLFVQQGLNIYHDKLPGLLQVTAQQLARKFLYDTEKELFNKGASKEDAIKVRPEKGQDPVERTMQVMMGVLEQVFKDGEIHLQSDGSGCITDFAYQSKDQGESR